MSALVDAVWDAFGLSARGPYSWIGFYLAQPGDSQMILGPRRDKPACSPIGLHGACGRSFTSGRSLVINDVASLGEGYIACDPRDRSEVVVPVFDEHGDPCAVLDGDSFDPAAFTAHDAAGLAQLLAAARLTSHAHPAIDII